MRLTGCCTPFFASPPVVRAGSFTKRMVETMSASTTPMKVFPGFFDIVHTENPGIAFGMLANPSCAWRNIFLIGFSGRSGADRHPAAALRAAGRLPSGPASHCFRRRPREISMTGSIADRDRFPRSARQPALLSGVQRRRQRHYRRRGLAFAGHVAGQGAESRHVPEVNIDR